MGLRTKNNNIIGAHQFLGEGREGHKKSIYIGNCLKRGAWTICRGLGKKYEGVFLEGVDTSIPSRGLIPRCTL